MWCTTLVVTDAHRYNNTLGSRGDLIKLTHEHAYNTINTSRYLRAHTYILDTLQRALMVIIGIISVISNYVDKKLSCCHVKRSSVLLAWNVDTISYDS